MLSDEDTVAVSSLVYGRWSQAMEELLAVRKEVDDGSVDWDEFHALRLELATTREADALGLWERWKAVYGAAINRVFGL